MVRSSFLRSFSSSRRRAASSNWRLVAAVCICWVSSSMRLVRSVVVALGLGVVWGVSRWVLVFLGWVVLWLLR